MTETRSVGSSVRHLRGRLAITGAALLLPLAVGCTTEEGSEATEESIEGEPAPDEASSGQGDEAETGSPTSASEGPEGRRDLDVLPDEFPAGVAPDDARDVEGRTSRSGDDWSVTASFVVDGDREAVARAVDARVREDGYELRRRVIEDSRVVSTYDGPSGLVMTVTVVPDGEALRGTATIIGN